MSTIKVDTIATRTGSGNITASNTIAGTSATLSGTLGVTGATTVGGDLTVDTSTLKVDSSNNRVGVGLTAPEQPLHVRSSTFAYVRSESTNSTLTGFDMGQHQDGSGHLNLRDNHPIKISTNDALRLRVDADGLKFGSDTAAANALDDYEEGTFTATLVATGSSFQYTYRTGSYTKIGNCVNFNLYIQLDGGGNSFVGNAVTITGLPFTSNSSANNNFRYYVHGRYLNVDGSNYYYVTANLSNGSATLSLNQAGDNVPNKALPATYLSSSSGQLFINGWYHI